MPTNKLFIICPECHLESVIRKNYDDNIFFLSGLGGMYLFDKFQDTEELNDLLRNENIKVMYIVNSLDCSFLQNVIQKNHFKDTNIERIYNNLYILNIEQFLPLKNDLDVAKKLVEMNIREQIKALKNVPYIGTKIEDGQIKVKGLLVDKKENSTKEILDAK